MATPTKTRPSTTYLGNSNSKEVHSLRNETPSCQIDKILSAGHAVTFSPDTLAQAHAEGYDNGHYCIGNSTR